MDAGAEQSSVSRASVLGGLVGGLIHAVVAGFLWHRFAFDSLLELLAVKPLTGTYVLLGMFALGFVPGLMYGGRRLVAPAFVVAILLLITSLGTWAAGPTRAPVGGPRPFGWYILAWVGVVVLAGLAGGFEHRWNRRDTR